jgi:hypothetical protein
MEKQGEVYYGLAHGLSIVSEIPSPAWMGGTPGEGDIRVVRRRVSPRWACDQGDQTVYEGFSFASEVENGRMAFRDPGGHLFSLQNGNTIEVQPNDEGPEETVPDTTFGMAMGLLLHQRGRLVFHAGAVEINGQGILLLGNSGAGKSTLSAALYARGHRCLSDDLVSCNLSDDGILTAYPAYPTVSVTDEAIVALGLAGRTRSVAPTVSGTKQPWALDRFRDTPVPITQVYLLTVGSKSRIQPLSERFSLMSLLRHLYGVRVLHQADRRYSLLQRCATISRHIPVFRLARPWALQALPESVKMIEGHLART